MIDELLVRVWTAVVELGPFPFDLPFDAPFMYFGRVAIDAERPRLAEQFFHNRIFSYPLAAHDLNAAIGDGEQPLRSFKY